MKTPRTSKGASANKQGKILERTIVPALESYGFKVVPFSEWKKDPTKFAGELVLKHVPYTTIYGHHGYSEFLLRSKKFGLEIRIECKWQQSGGSVDEKLPYLYLNCLEALTETEVIIVIGGGGMKKGAISWLKSAIETEKYLKPQQAKKKLHVFSLEEFVLWANSTLGK